MTTQKTEQRITGYPAKIKLEQARETLQIMQANFLRESLRGERPPVHLTTWLAVELGTACPVYAPEIHTVHAHPRH
jgi:hypothetical protein